MELPFVQVWGSGAAGPAVGFENVKKVRVATLWLI